MNSRTAHISAASISDRAPAQWSVAPGRAGSTLVIVLWITFGLVSLTLYFAHSMGLELRASENRVAGLAAEQTIEGAARYVNALLASQIALGSNGFMPNPDTSLSESVKVGDCHFWLIGRDPNYLTGAGQLNFGLVDEAGKVNLNSAASNIVWSLVTQLPLAGQDLAPAIVDWRDTNSTGTYQTFYAMQSPPYASKSAPFETVDELRLVYGADYNLLVGEDLNRNGVLDPNEDQNHNGTLDPGLLEYVTIYSREPVANLTNVNTALEPDLEAMFSNAGVASATTLANAVFQSIHPASAPGRPVPPRPCASPLDFYNRCKTAGISSDDFARVSPYVSTSDATNYIEGRININTASATVLASLPGISDTPSLADTLVNYRTANPDKLTSIAWIADALQGNQDALTSLEAVDCITTMSYQFSADIAALGPHGRGFRRVRFVFDTSSGAPQIVYRQDLTRLGWALGQNIRQTWVTGQQVTDARSAGRRLSTMIAALPTGSSLFFP